MPVEEAQVEDTPYGRYVTSDAASDPDEAYAGRSHDLGSVRLPWPSS